MLLNTLERYGLTLRLIEIEDAAFILKLRNDVQLSKYLSKTSNDLQDQIDWIKNYKIREAKGEEYYFITIGPDQQRYGTTRISELQYGECFELGSWLFARDSAPGTSILADLITREIGFDLLKFSSCKFSVRKDNKSVLRYHKQYNPTLVNETEIDMFFTLTKEAFNKIKPRILNFYNHGT